MNLIQQPPNSNLCGQTCIAMLANTTPARVATALGNNGPMAWEEVYSALHQFGIICTPQLRPCFEEADLPPVAIIEMPSGTAVLRHLVVKYGPWVYDPAIPLPQQAADLPFETGPANRVLRYAEVKNIKYLSRKAKSERLKE